MKFNKTLLSVALLSATSAMAYQTDKTYSFTLLHTNDIHGHFWQNDKGEYGLAAQKTLIDNIKKEVEAKGGSTIILNAGDINTGVPESDMQNARPDYEGLNAIGYEAMVLGNHEFDFPLQILSMQEKWATFPLISANVINKRTQKELTKPYVMLDKQGLKVAVVGLTTEDTGKLGNPEVTENVIFKDPIKTAKETLAEINNSEKPDVRIALTHMGWYLDGKHGSNAPGDVTMARTLDKGAFDIIIGGHTHDTVCFDEKGQFRAKYTPGESCQPDFQNGTWIMQAGEWGKYVGRADFEFKNGKTTLVKYELIPINLKKTIKKEDGKKEYQLYQPEIKADQALFDHLKKYQDEGDKLLSVEVGEVKGLLDGKREHVRFVQTNLGRLIAQSQKERVKADIGIMNSGGVRASIEEGKVTYKTLLTVQPFGNMISTVDLKGQELLDFLTTVALKEVDTGAYPQFAGISMTVDRTAKAISNVKIAGKPFDPNKTYKVSIPDYLTAGGDGYPVMKKHPSYVNTGFIDAEMLKKYFEENKVIDASKFDPKEDIIFK
ncbi:bifunctional UDP-sugar hydrolase/5'-nucleotidase UshA [Actinobacillus equuli subsp. equuli]|uniref:Bifunctional UDP-sugar hydrolase/5'-nucleotidase UshA n=1 Tax=Actinobacillus equuli subsp. equuli TaxID=202947 RepID=A0A9X4JC65_ACTEU|nr:bifunctional UDP-sugar hydrolase/5'-nucleotidase UshA [Actinobacillus equuli]MDE8034661.1 bifunctional UDP-sugar hydrolase/5'-nucleotidase UshA [Actinobacillus equuli subsp. equuli]MDG4948700.1 bifunctional UDP-sugar hydrolase/5'-nucleotidase UshA [Actinobacillus equuli subsp. haemolyticus]WGE65965.1 bifunctional UDP-sugar hydrolase/5'-nucleotidase UshA [Actinobacillus equuli subsp. equuli]WGE70818.1 bifunctional UDP-sugar hydrolase/5'-nucleotidase UshA [Actinobacillus equuli subsp. haemolyt